MESGVFCFFFFSLCKKTSFTSVPQSYSILHVNIVSLWGGRRKSVLNAEPSEVSVDTPWRFST